MGWLKVRWTERGYTSPNRLAKALIAADGWPAPEMEARYVGNRLREVDEGRNLGWWLERDQHLRVLAAAIEVDREQLRTHLETGEPGTTTSRDLWPLDVLGSHVAALDLRKERPFPGIPDELLDPTLWAGPIWWHAPPGSGRTLAGRWLRARGLLPPPAVIEARTWEEALQLIDGPGPVFVSLDEAGDAVATPPSRGMRIVVASPRLPDGPAPPTREERNEGSLGLLDTRYLERKHGNAGEEAASAEREDEAPPGSMLGDWSIVHAHPPDQWLHELLAWARQRLPVDKRFEVGPVRQLLGPEGQLHRLARTPGDVLGLVRLIVDIGVEAAGQVAQKEWIQHHIRAVTSRRDKQTPAGALLEQRGASVVTGLARNGLLTGLNAAAGLTLEQWTALIPPELTTPPSPADADRVLESAERMGDVASIGEARRLLVGGPLPLLDGLLRFGFLARQEADRYRLSPPWLATIAHGIAVEELLDGAPAEWGRVALDPTHLAELVESLARRTGESLHDAVLAAVEGAARGDPASVGAVDVAFRAVAIAVLDGALVELDVIARVWDAEHAFALPVYPGHPPRPAIEARQTDIKGPPAGSPRMWELGSLVLSEVLGGDRARHDGAHAALAPWGLLQQHESLANVLNSANFLAWHDDLDDRWRRRRRAAYAVAGRLFQQIGNVAEWPGEQKPNAMMFAAALVSAFRVGVDAQNGVSWFLYHPRSDFLTIVRDETEAQGADFPAFVAWLWQGWTADLGNFPVGEWIRHGHEGAAEIWRLAPAESVRAVLEQFYNLQNEFPDWSLFTDEHWQVWIEIAAQHADSRLIGPWLAMPEAILREAIRNGRVKPVHQLAQAIWEHRDELAWEVVRSMWPTQPDGVVGLIYEVPAPRLGDAIALVREGISEAPTEERQRALRWCHRLVAERRGEWRLAYALMVELGGRTG